MNLFRLALFLLISGLAFSQEVPAGTVIPVKLDSGLDAKKDKAGKGVKGKIMQEVLLPSGGKIRKKSEIRGHVISVTNAGSSGSRIILRFDTIQDYERIIPVRAALLALASTRNTWLHRQSVVKLTPSPEAGCPARPGYEREQAVWIFSAAACGAYRLGRVKIASSGAISSVGEIQLTSSGNLALHGSTAWLLIVTSD